MEPCVFLDDLFFFFSKEQIDDYAMIKIKHPMNESKKLNYTRMDWGIRDVDSAFDRKIRLLCLLK